MKPWSYRIDAGRRVYLEDKPKHHGASSGSIGPVTFTMYNDDDEYEALGEQAIKEAEEELDPWLKGDPWQQGPSGGRRVPAEDPSHTIRREASGSVVGSKGETSDAKDDGRSLTTHLHARREAPEGDADPMAAGTDEDKPEGKMALPWYNSHERTRLEDGEIGILIDPGAHGNLAGEHWARSLRDAAESAAAAPTTLVKTLKHPLEVNGVGKNSQHCYEEWQMPIGTQEADEEDIGVGSVNTFTAPIIPNSHVPGLLGNESLMEHDAILQVGRGILHLPGPGYNGDLVLPPGTKTFKLRLTRSGHWLLPCSRFAAALSRRTSTGHAADRLVPNETDESIALNAVASAGSDCADGRVRAEQAATGSAGSGAAPPSLD